MLQSKASNFRKMLAEQPQSTEAEALVASYNEAELVPLIKTHLMPLFVTNSLDVAVAKVVEVYPDVDAVKVKRYLSCFCECVLVNNVG